VAGPRGSRRTAIACGGLLAAWLACTAGSRLVAGTGLQCGILSAQRPTAPAPGDHIVVPRGIYAHHGIYCGEGQVASYIWQPGGVRFVMTPMIQYARGGPVAVRSYAACRPTAEVLAGVRQHLGEHRYSGVLRNCEHLATLCKTGRAESWQIEAVVSAVLAGILLGSASARWPRATDGVRD